MIVTSRRLAYVTSFAAAITLLAQAADFVKPDIRPGLWEVTSNPQVSGEMPIPEEELAKLPPDQRARLEAAMKAGIAGAAKTHVYKECMTPEKIAKGFDTQNPDETASCQKNVIKSSTNELHVHEDCNRNGGKASVDVHFQISGGVQMTGTINAVMTSGSRTMTMNSKLAGKWLGTSCGTIKDAQEQK
jgi:hypothetical protein